MSRMSDEEVRIMAEINDRLASKNLKSRLSYLYIAGIKEATITEWEWERTFPNEGAEPSIVVSETIREILDSE